MRDLLFPLLMFPSMLAIVPSNIDEADSWWQKAQKNGVGFVFFILFLGVMYLNYRREKKDEIERAKREQESQAERIAMAAKNNELTEKLIGQHKEHSLRLEQIIKDGNKAQADIGQEMKNLARKIRCPGSQA